MSTLSAPSVVSTPATRTRIVRCPGCHSNHAVPAESLNLWPLCPACNKSAADAEARKLINDVRDLRRGTGVFSVLSLDERLEQLEAMGFSQSPTLFDDTLAEAARMPEVVRKLASDVLIDLAAHTADEVARRLGSCDVPAADEYAPESAVRIAIEDQLEDEARELAMAADAAESPDQFDVF